eukprot:12920309-Prorocentrum_lima.AAC.1
MWMNSLSPRALAIGKGGAGPQQPPPAEPPISNVHLKSAWDKFRIPPVIRFRPERGGYELHLTRIGSGKQRDVFIVEGCDEWIAKLE